MYHNEFPKKGDMHISCGLKKSLIDETIRLHLTKFRYSKIT